MTESERQKYLQERMDFINSQRVQQPPEGAGGAILDPEKGPKLPALGYPSTAQQLVEGGGILASAMAGGAAGAEFVAPAAAFAGPYAPVVEIAGAGIGAGLAATGAQGVVEFGRHSMGLPGANASFKESLSNMVHTGAEMGSGEMVGRAGIHAQMPDTLFPYSKVVTPQTYDDVMTMGDKLKSSYEGITGRPWSGDSWNPFKRAAAVGDITPADRQALIARGINPEDAFEVVRTRGIMPTELPRSIFTRLQGMSNTVQPAPNSGYLEARSKLFRAQLGADVGNGFAQTLSPEEQGKVLHSAVLGQFQSAEIPFRVAMNGFKSQLPDDWSMNAMPVVYRPAGWGADLLGTGKLPDDKVGALVAHELAGGETGRASFEKAQVARQDLMTMVRDPSLTTQAQNEAKALVKRIDDQIVRDLPSNMRQGYKSWAKSNVPENDALFNQKFIEGLTSKEGSAKAYADYLIENSDAGNFHLMDKIMSKAPNGPAWMGDVRRSISNNILDGATDASGFLDPDKLRYAMQNYNQGYGKYFTKSVMGNDYVANLDKYSNAIDAINAGAKRMGSIPSKVAGVGVAAGATIAFSIGREAVRTGDWAQAINRPGQLAAVTAMVMSPAIAKWVMTNPVSGRLFVRAARYVAQGEMPNTAARLLGQALTAAGISLTDAQRVINQRNQMENQGYSPEQAAQIMSNPAISPVGTSAAQRPQAPVYQKTGPTGPPPQPVPPVQLPPPATQ